MISKLITIIFLISLVSTLWMVWKYQLNLKNEALITKVLTVMFFGYILAVTYIYVNTLHWNKPVLFLTMLTFCPFVGFLLMIFKKYEYAGDLNIFVLAIMLNCLGLVGLYRLDIDSGWFLTGAIGYEEKVPMVLKQELYSMVALCGMTWGITKGIFDKILLKIADSSGAIFWGVCAFVLLALPKLLGLSTWLTTDKSIQPSEFAFKIIFLLFISKYYDSKAPELLLKHYPFKEVVKLVLFIIIGIVVFFFAPLVLLAKELGTVLLIGLTFIIWTSYITRRVSFFFAGIAFLVVAMYLGVLTSDHVAKRVIAAWLEWKQFAFKPFSEGGNLYPGYQIFTALAAIRLSPWGVGIGNGILKHATVNKTIIPMAVNDFAAIPLAAEMGIIAIFVIGVSYLVLLDKAIPLNRTLNFRSILAAGIAIALITQGFYNLSGVIALLPATGIPLPWISYGGSALFANYILAGFLVTILNGQNEALDEK
ncbi:MAG: FtsW/RodA/SpoVE family cell cycle protein [Syntrophales bacterium]|nr:FtsW/RodA/SpoVE family cell cycle protein [Syntrophales bacterium]